MSKNTLIIATRESPLALWQANWVKARIKNLYPHLHIELLGLTTEADKMLETPLTEIGGKGLFVKELENALRAKKADIAVHSMKDMPMDLPDGLILPVMCEREDPRDAFVSNNFSSIKALPQNAQIGTSSLRRQAQVRLLRPDCNLINLRGNVNTRLAKLDRNDFSAIILAVAGLKRLGLETRIRSILTLEESLPAAGQGVLGIECRSDDLATQTLLAPLNHFVSATCVTAERAMCKILGGGCQVPVAAYAEIKQDKIHLRGLVARIDGTLILRAEACGDINSAKEIGVKVAEELLQQGAMEILNCYPKKI